MSHHRNVKNLVLDYPHAALPLYAAEAASLDPDARIVPVRQEQLQERLSERFRELDIPLLVEWPDGRRAALEPDPQKRLKYLDFIDIYADLSDGERLQATIRRTPTP
ncbi:MAG: hypothetical protein PVG09_03600 [Thiohalocapsa sp.]|jgi:hypothetical protein